MASRVKGARLENEVERCRAESSWPRLDELMSSVRAKGSGLESLANFLNAELILENFVEQRSSTDGEMPKPSPSHVPLLKTAKVQLDLAANNIDSSKACTALEALLLLAKLHYLCADYTAAVDAVNRSEKLDTQFQSLRTLRLVSEAYAIKGLSLEHIGAPPQATSSRYQKLEHDRKILNCFEKASELSLAYIQELEKALNQPPPPTGYFASFSVSTPSSGASSAPVSLSVPPASAPVTTIATSSAGGVIRPSERIVPSARQRIKEYSGLISELMETAIQRVPLLQLAATSVTKPIELGVEEYRKVLTVTGERAMAQQLHQKVSRQLAEVLLRGVPEGSYRPPSDSPAVEHKAQSLRFYIGSDKHYYFPENREEELLLLLSISEALAAREAVLGRAEEDRSAREESLMNVKAVHNLLTLVLSSVRQYALLAGVLEKALKFAYEDRFVWRQFALALLCHGRWSRAVAFLRDDCDEPVQLMLAAQTAIEKINNYDQGIFYAHRAVDACGVGWLAGRAHLLLGLGYGLKAQNAGACGQRKTLQRDAVDALSEAVRCDPKDHLAEFFLALQLAIGRDLDGAKTHLDRSLELCEGQPAGWLLFALLLTAEGEHTEALSLVHDALEHHPSHYGLLVLRLKLEALFGRAEEALRTALDLLMFWKANPTKEPVTVTSSATTGVGGFATSERGVSPPSGTAPSLLVAERLQPSASAIDLTDKESVVGGTSGNLSEYGGVASTVSESMGIGSAGSYCTLHQRFKLQANIWLELAELFLDCGRVNDVNRCVEEACATFPNSHQTLYLKGRVLESSGSLAEAKTCYLGALAVFPQHIPSLRRLASVYRLQENLPMAEKMLREVVAVDVWEQDSWQSLGEVLAEAGRVDDATRCLAAAAALRRTSPLIPFTAIPRQIHV